MKLIKCYISSFGKLKDYSIDFSPSGISILEENGFGKTTVSVFIKSMFFGLNDSKKSIAENERKKYCPWNSTDKFGGFIEYEYQGGLYKVERFFGRKNSEDTLSIIDLKTGKNIPSDFDFARKIFDIDEDGFFSTAYISQDKKTNLNSLDKLSGEDTFEVDKYLSAVSSVEKKLKTLKSRGEKGIIAEKRSLLFSIREKLATAKVAKEQLDNVDREILLVNNKIANNKKEIFALNQNLSNVLSKTSGDKTIHSSQEKENIERIFNGFIPTERSLDENIEYAKEVSALNNEKYIISQNVERLRNSNEELTIKPNRKNLISKITLLVLSCVIMIFGGAFAFFDFTVGIATLLIGVGLFSASFLIKVKSKKDNFELKNRLTEQIKRLTEIDERINNLNSILREYLSNFNLPTFNGFLQSLYLIKDYLYRYNEIFETEKESLYIVKQTTLVSDNVENVEKLLLQKEKDFEKLNADLASLLAKRERLCEITDGELDLLNQEIDVKKEIDEFNKEYLVLETTLKFLNMAHESLKSKLKSPVEERLNYYLAELTAGAKSLQIDTDYNMKVLENSGEMALDFYSEGYRNLFDICRRFALIDVLYKKEKPFIILDDPFVNFDDEKVKICLKLLEKIKEKYQVIYFTCHESRKL